jgi:hypothetical protein
MSSYLAEARYGKDKVRVFRVVRGDEIHHVVEYNVQVLLEGDLDTRQASFFLLRVVVLKGGQLYTSGQQRRRRNRFNEEYRIL